MSTPKVAAVATQPQAANRAWRWSTAAHAGFAYVRAGRGKHIAFAHGKHVSTATRYQQGAPYSPLARAYETLAESPHTTAFPALTEAWVVVTRAEIEAVSTEQLMERRNGLESLLDADLPHQVFHAKYAGGDMRDLRARMADAALELTAIEDELAGRKAGR